MVKVRSKSEEKRRLMLAAATELFVQQGFSATSMDQIAKKAGVSKQTVYSHFGNKEELFTAAIASKCVAYKMTADMFTQGSCRQVLLEMGRMFSKLLLSEEAIGVFRICIAESESYPKLAQLFFAAGPERVIDLFSQYLLQLDKEQVLCIPQPRFAAVQLLKMLQGEARMLAELNMADKIDHQQHQLYIENCVDMFIRAHRPEPVVKL